MENIEVGKMYKLNAQWHNRHGEMVEIVQTRESITKAYSGRQIFHVAYSPLDPDRRTEDLDEEFIADNFRELVLDDDVDLFDLVEFFPDLPQDLAECVNKIQEDEDLNSYVFLYDGFLEVTFGKDEDDARRNAFKYMVLKSKIDENGDLIEEALGENDENKDDGIQV